MTVTLPFWFAMRVLVKSHFSLKERKYCYNDSWELYIITVTLTLVILRTTLEKIKTRVQKV